LTHESTEPGPHSATGRSASPRTSGPSDGANTERAGNRDSRKAGDSDYRYDSEAPPTMTDFDMSYHRGGASGAAAGP
jgi:hypothetical protein